MALATADSIETKNSTTHSSYLQILKSQSEVRHEDLVPYYHTVIELANLFDSFYIGHVSRSQNTKADAVAALATMLALPVDTEYHLTVATRNLVCSKHMLEPERSIISRRILSREIGDFLSSTMLYMPPLVRLMF